MYLVDTNIWLELLLAQAKADEVGKFFDRVMSGQLYVSDFSFHSICVILTRLKQNQTLLKFVKDVFIDNAVTLLSVQPDETQNVIDLMDAYNLDFDDAYQCFIAERNNLVLVSFDSDFNRTTRGKKIPSEI